MKLRILGDSLRLRLSQSEVERIGAGGQVREQIRFGGEQVLTYQLSASDTSELFASFTDQLIHVHFPKDQLFQWANSDQVGLSNEQPINEQERLRILVEKDFKCLTPRPHEDESDLFANPQSSHPDC